MIDTHCHLEQSDYSKDRDIVIERCKQHLQAVIISCSNLKHFNTTIQLVKQHKGFVFAATSIHPQYVKEFEEKLPGVTIIIGRDDLKFTTITSKQVFSQKLAGNI